MISLFDQILGTAKGENFLAQKLPPKILLSISSFLIMLTVGVILFCSLVPLPEVVEAPFVLEPKGGIESIRAEQDGSIVALKVREGQNVEAGETLFVLHSEVALDRSSELSTVSAKLTANRQSLTNLLQQEKLNQENYETKLKILAKRKELKERELEYQNDKVIYAKTYHQNSLKVGGAVSSRELHRLKLDLDQALTELSSTQKELDLIALERDENAALRHKEESQYQEGKVTLEQEISSAESKVTTLQQRSAAPEDREMVGKLVVRSPIAGTIYRLPVKRAGGYIAEGEVLAEIAPRSEQLIAKIQVPESGLGKFNRGQEVKLLFDAFPYQRYGIGHGSITWVSPVVARQGGASGAAESPARGGMSIEAHAMLGEKGIDSGEREIPYTAGMSGIARIVVSESTIVGYLIEPLRSLRERMR